MKNQILGYFLSIPNSNPDVLPINKGRFYFFKDEFLRKFCKDDGYDLQHIEKICHACEGTGKYRHEHGGKEPCYRCADGIYESIYVVLVRYYMGNRLFYKPISRVLSPPPKMKFKNEIEGYITHKKSGVMAVLFVYLFLTLFFERFLFWEAIMAVAGNFKGTIQWKYERFTGSIRRWFRSFWNDPGRGYSDNGEFSESDIPF